MGIEEKNAAKTPEASEQDTTAAEATAPETSAKEETAPETSEQEASAAEAVQEPERVAVLYASSHGSTKRCAEWAASGLGVKAESLTGMSARPERLGKLEAVVFGGWVNSGKITGLKHLLPRFKSSGCPRLVLFAVGITKPTGELREKLLMKNVPEELRAKTDFFLIRGAMNRSLLSFAEDARLKLTRINIERKKNPTNEERENWHAITFPSDFTSPAAMVPVTVRAREYLQER